LTFLFLVEDFEGLRVQRVSISFDQVSGAVSGVELGSLVESGVDS